jgi:predicted transcriptional regulator
MKLKDFLIKNRISPEEFAKLSGLSRSSIFFYLQGRTPRFKTAIFIEEFTKGAVMLEDWEGLYERKKKKR